MRFKAEAIVEDANGPHKRLTITRMLEGDVDAAFFFRAPGGMYVELGEFVVIEGESEDQFARVVESLGCPPSNAYDNGWGDDGQRLTWEGYES